MSPDLSFFYFIVFLKSSHFVFFIFTFYVPNLFLCVFLVIIMVLTWPYLADFFFIISSIQGRYSTHAHFFFQCVLKVLKGCVFLLFFLDIFGHILYSRMPVFFSNGCVFCPYVVFFLWVFFLYFPLNLAFFDGMWGMFRNGSFKYTKCFLICFFLRSLTASSVLFSLLSIWCFGAWHSSTIFIRRSYLHV